MVTHWIAMLFFGVLGTKTSLCACLHVIITRASLLYHVCTSDKIKYRLPLIFHRHLSANEPLILGLFCRNWPMKNKDMHAQPYGRTKAIFGHTLSHVITHCHTVKNSGGFFQIVCHTMVGCNNGGGGGNFSKIKRLVAKWIRTRKRLFSGFFASRIGSTIN